MDAALMGVVDRIQSIKGIQIVGNFEKIGFQGAPHRSKGENLALVDELMEIKLEQSQLVQKMDYRVSQLLGEGHSITGMMSLREYGPQFAQTEKFQILANDPEFSQLKADFKRVYSRIEEVADILTI